MSDTERKADAEPDLGMDCTALLADVWLMLDGECDEATRSRLQHHMDTCSPCIEVYGIEEKIKSLLSRKCGGDRAPDSLRERLTLELRRSVCISVETTQITIDTTQVTIETTQLDKPESV